MSEENKKWIPEILYEEGDGSFTSHIPFVHVPENEEISVNYKEGKSLEVNVHDGSKMVLYKLNKNYDPSSRRKAIGRINDSREKGEIITGLIYLDPNEVDLHDTLQTSKKPFNQLTKKDLSPGVKKLNQINKIFS